MKKHYKYKHSLEWNLLKDSRRTMYLGFIIGGLCVLVGVLKFLVLIGVCE